MGAMLSRVELSLRTLARGGMGLARVVMGSFILFVVSMPVVALMYSMGLVAIGKTTFMLVAFFCATVWAWFMLVMWFFARITFKAWNGVAKLPKLLLIPFGKQDLYLPDLVTPEDLQVIRHATFGSLAWLIFFVGLIWLLPMHIMPWGILAMWVAFIFLFMRQEGWKTNPPKWSMRLAAFAAFSVMSTIIIKVTFPHFAYAIYGGEPPAEQASDSFFGTIDTLGAEWVNKGKQYTKQHLRPKRATTENDETSEDSLSEISPMARLVKTSVSRMESETGDELHDEQRRVAIACAQVTEDDLNEEEVKSACNQYGSP